MKAARNEDGKTYHLPADMTYRDWEKQLVVQKSKGLLKRNKKNDKITIFKAISDLIHLITDESIINVSDIKIPDLFDETNQIIYEQRKELLKEVQKQPVGIEGSVIINLNVEKDYYLINDFLNELLNEGEEYGFEIVKG